jgi:hypothetical protein
MKTRLGLQATVAMILIIAATTVQAQHRGRDRDNNSGRDRGNSGRGNNGRHEDRHDNRHDNHHDNNRHNGHHDNNHHGYHRKDVHVYHHHHAPVVERRVVHHHHHSRPRYVYYKDYDVYYDCDRQVYISFSGRNWTVSVAQPIRLHRVDIYRASRVDVDYYDDDFTQYLEQRRPHGRVYAEW